MIDRRALLGRIGMGSASAIAGGSCQARPPRPMRTVSVLDFGAVGDGRTDDTAAFNRACQAGAAWSEELCYAIHVPSGRYRIDGTVYVRKGQTLFGDGHATHIDARRATASTFILGRRDTGSKRGTPDPGGAPVRISELHSTGGAPAHGFVETDAQGFSITGLFLTAVGIGIEISGGDGNIASDGIVHDIFIDQCLQGIIIGKAQNINLGLINIYRPRFALTIGDGAHDIIINTISITYTERVGITFSGGSVSNIIISNSTFVSNGQYEEFISNILLRNSSGDAMFTGCTFRNWPGTSTIQDRPGDISITFNNCVFDANRTSADYDWSKASDVLKASMAGAFSFQGCTFRGLRGPLARLPEGSAHLTLAGGMVEGSDMHRLVVDRRFAGAISIRNVSGFAPVEKNGRQARTFLPVWPGAGPWKITGRLPHPISFAQEAIVQVTGGEASILGGWRSAGDLQMRFTVSNASQGMLLEAAMETDNPEGATFLVETID